MIKTLLELQLLPFTAPSKIAKKNKQRRQRKGKRT